MQLKAIVNKRAKEAGVAAQLVLQNYMLERLLERISVSKYRDQVIIKGGVLIGSLIGIEKRTTMDMDTTIRGFTLTHENAIRIFGEICAIDMDDDIEFEMLRVEDIREIDDYPGIRIFVKAHYPPLAVPLTVDVTTGDAITPEAVTYKYPLLFEERSIRVMAYSVETVLAEKVETVISRGVANTRPRDYYDVYALYNLRSDEISALTLREAILVTTAKRGTSEITRRYGEILEVLQRDVQLEQRWSGYARRYSYAHGISFSETCDAVREVMRRAFT